MSNQEVFDKVAQLIANRFSVDVETVTEGMTFQQDLGADSLDVVELVMELEDDLVFKFLTKMQKTLQQLETRLIILQLINKKMGKLEVKNFRLFLSFS